jgi:4-diphosphocytidyl-2C-methyl-D-erythritol kinase
MRETRPATTSVTVRAPAKVNLYLGVGAPRPDGFHPLATVYQAVGLYDDVTVADAPEWTVGLVEADDDVPLGEDNIAVKAGRALVAHHGLDRAARITIAKGIPVAGGMAGGSADAAATLIALDRLWDLGTSDEDLLALAAALGSDVPFSLVGGTATGVGRGEVVSPVPDLTSVWWVVVLAAEGLSTPAVYRHFDDLSPDAEAEPELPARLLAALASGSYDDVALGLGNDLWDAARELRPELAATEADLAGVGADAILLSGSGPTMLMLYGDVGAARSAAAEVAALGYRCVLAPGPVAGAHVVTYG